MSATTDFVHDEEIVDAVIAQLKEHLPEAWAEGGNPISRLQCLQFGDLRDYRFSPGKGWQDICPAILVRLNRSDRAPEYGGLGGKEGQVVPLRLLHVRTREQCPDPDDPQLTMPPARARAYYAKIISKALFANRDLGRPSLTTDDTSARVVELRPKAIVYEGEKADMELAARHDLVAFGIDFEVVVRTQ
jgi:hypothetical protein